MVRSFKYNYILQMPVQKDGNTVFREIPFNRWAEKEEAIKTMLNEKSRPAKAKFYIYYQTGKGKQKIENQLAKIGALKRIYNIGSGDVEIKRWEIEVEAVLEKNGDLILKLS